MSLSKSITSYDHVKAVLLEALAHERCELPCATPSAANRWRQEAYYFRRLITASGDHRFAGLLLRLNGSSVLIEKRPSATALITQDGTPITVDHAAAPDALEDFALDFARKLGVSDD